jgi:hypothetical protein
MAITFRDEGNLGLGSFVQVLRNGRRLGRIFHTAGVYRFYMGEKPKLGGADLQDKVLERLKDKIRDTHPPKRREVRGRWSA